MNAFRLGPSTLVAETPIAQVWKTEWKDRAAALKIYKNNDIKDEAAGLALAAALEGQGMAYVYARTGAAVLMEWLDGETLGQMSRGGQDLASADLIAKVANHIHGSEPDMTLPHLSAQMAALSNLRIDLSWSETNRASMKFAQDLLHELLTMRTDESVLHGDLHHDNIIAGHRGYLAIDAKGLYGDRAYEVANVFRNPVGNPEIYDDTKRIAALVALFAKNMSLPRKRILGWALVLCAIGMVWDDAVADNPHHSLLTKLIAAYKSEIA